MHDNPGEVGGADAGPVDHPAAAGGQRRSGCGELAGWCSALAAEVAAVAGRPRLGEPAAEMLGYAVRALRLAADLIGLARPYEQRCELGWAVFGSGGDWAVCSPPADAGRLRMPEASRAGCLVHLASAVGLGLGTLDAGQGVRDEVADRIRQAAAGEDDAGRMCQLGKQSQLTSDLFYRCHGDRRFGRYVFTGSGRRASGCIVHLVEQSLRGRGGGLPAAGRWAAAGDPGGGHPQPVPRAEPAAAVHPALPQPRAGPPAVAWDARAGHRRAARMSPTPAAGDPARPAAAARAARPDQDTDGTEPTAGARSRPATAGGGSRRRRTPPDRGRQAFARHLGAGMTRGGWTLRGLARQLTAAGTPVSPATLGAWLRGAAAPDHPAGSAALGMAEITLGIPAGDLPLRLALPNQRLHPIPPVIAYTGRTDTAASIARVAGVTGSALQAAAADRIGRQPLMLTALAWHHHVGADGRPAYSRAAVAVRALDELVGGYWLLHHHAGTGPPPAWAAGRGARILAVHSDRSGLAAAEVAFPRWLTPGDHHVFTVAVRHTHPTAEPTAGSADAFRYVACALPMPLARGSLRLTFHTPPRRVEQTRWDLHPHLDPATPTEREEADPDQPGGVFRRLDGSTPAAYGWRWR